MDGIFDAMIKQNFYAEQIVASFDQIMVDIF